MDRNAYENPLSLRYASREMNAVWSPDRKFSTWRRLWLALAQAEKELGLPITQGQLDEMARHLDDINYEFAEAKEKELRHDVMSHIAAFGELCPAARPIIHLGATSCEITDNTELIQTRDALRLVRTKLVGVMGALRQFAFTHRSLPTLGFTHFQPAQLTTVGKRACLWLYDLLLDLQEVERLLAELPFRGVKGTTGTQASFMELFEDNGASVEALDRRVTELMGFERAVPVSGQTYSRKWDYRTLTVLAGIAQSAAKMATDVRLLAHLKEIEEPFGDKQVGSSAMAYKRNPMRSERVCSLARYVISLTDNAAQTHASQWFERTLDDSANRRLSLPESFLAVDIILSTLTNVASGLQVWPNVIARHVREELPFMATEAIIMACVKAGGDRQDIHEAIRQHSMTAGRRVKQDGAPNNLLELIRDDPRFTAIHGQLDDLLDPARFIGRAPRQVEQFLATHVDPALQRLGAKQTGATEAVTV
ncbi:MAG: adenylosuccinate lyase [Lentisphaerae bacterium RIFOXYB12_FULL_65_16]|nr:MAG: adenylosuccinate lyase [Lentisphaerae bacterium RIFOXYA12_64_32]OGV92942.1 MAG: adenylosuccinate lyase [Lentisphaerae bacterium RIFOXYB12_FULL_65_16]